MFEKLEQVIEGAVEVSLSLAISSIWMGIAYWKRDRSLPLRLQNILGQSLRWGFLFVALGGVVVGMLMWSILGNEEMTILLRNDFAGFVGRGIVLWLFLSSIVASSLLVFPGLFQTRSQ